MTRIVLPDNEKFWLDASDGKYYISAKSPKRGLYGGLTVEFPMSCCGLGSFSGMSYVDSLIVHAGEAEFLSFLYRRCATAGRSMLYCLTTAQMQSNYTVHELFKKLGAVQLGEKFPNINHGPNNLYIWKVELRKAIGFYIDGQGNALKEIKEPKPSVVVAPKVAVPKAVVKPFRNHLGQFAKKVDPVAAVHERNLLK